MLTKLLRFQELNRGLTNWTQFSPRYNTEDAFKAEIVLLSKRFLNLQLTTCSSCYFDAYIQLMLLNEEKAMKKLNCDFELRSGVLLQGEHVSQNMTKVNITNELALYHIRRNPNCKKLFLKLPANLEELLYQPVVEDIVEVPVVEIPVAKAPVEIPVVKTPVEPVPIVEIPKAKTPVEIPVVKPPVAKVPDFSKVGKV